MKAVLNSIACSIALLTTVGLQNSAHAQIEAQLNGLGGTGTIVTPNGTTIDITGGSTSATNLFHSFQKFGLNQNQTANLIAAPNIQNILGRVVGGEASVINGVIQVTGGSNPNLYLMNSAGIIFGSSASLNVPGSFIATTASGIGFGDNNGNNQWFSAIGQNNYAALIGNPTSLAFSLSQPGAIVNAGTLAVGSDKSLILAAGTVVSTAAIDSRGGITIAAIPGSSFVKISQTDSILSLEIPVAIGTNQPNSLPADFALSLPKLLTGGSAGQAYGLTVDNAGAVTITASGLPVNNGDVAVGSFNNNFMGMFGNPNSFVSIMGDQNVTVSDTLATGGRVSITGGTITTQNIRGDDSRSNPFFGLELTSRGDIQVNDLKSVRLVKLTSAQGNISVNTIEAYGDFPYLVEVLINTPGLFQARGSLTRNVSVPVTRINIDAPENQDIKQYLQTQGILNPNGSINPSINQPVGAREPIVSANAGVRTVVAETKEIPISILVRQGDPTPIIRIQHGGQAIDTTGSSYLTITGAGQGQFVVGSEVSRLSQFQIIPNFEASITTTSSYTGPALRYQSLAALPFDSAKFPRTVSGTAGAIATGAGSNAVLGRSFINIPFDPNKPINNPGSGNSNPGSGSQNTTNITNPTNPTQPVVATNSAETQAATNTTNPPQPQVQTSIDSTATQTVQRQQSDRAALCNNTTIAAVPTDPVTRSSVQTSQPCSQIDPKDDAQILRILQTEPAPNPGKLLTSTATATPWYRR
jgi:filamentous hemagglutinin family protein